MDSGHAAYTVEATQMTHSVGLLRNFGAVQHVQASRFTFFSQDQEVTLHRRSRDIATVRPTAKLGARPIFVSRVREAI